MKLSDFSGRISSPNYPQNYPNGVTCEWIIDVGPGYDITLIFHEFTLETAENCPYDWLTVQEGITPAAPVIAKLCSNVLPPEITTRGSMRIVFQTDGDKEFRGFLITYNVQGKMHQKALLIRS